jgi:zinc transport system ATP-binding protein
MPIISLENITLSIAGNTILEDISFSIKKGDYIGLIGPNGAGKSTLLKLILGLISPTSGKVIKDENINFGYVPQNYFLNTNFSISVKEVIFMSSNSPFFWTTNKEKEKFLEVLKWWILKVFF